MDAIADMEKLLSHLLYNTDPYYVQKHILWIQILD